MLIEEKLNEILKEKFKDKKIKVKLAEFFNYLYIYRIKEIRVLRKGKIKIKEKYIRIGRIDFEEFYNDFCKLVFIKDLEIRKKLEKEILNKIIEKIKEKI